MDLTNDKSVSEHMRCSILGEEEQEREGRSERGKGRREGEGKGGESG